MFTRIVVPLDGSVLAARALLQATELAHAIGVPLHLVRVLDFGYLTKLAGFPVHGTYIELTAFQQALQDERDAAEDYLKGLCHDLTTQGLTATFALPQGNPVPEIVASTEPGDVVVMTTHGRGGIARWFLGSVAEGVVRRATVPVMLVRSSDVVTEGRRSLEPAAAMLV